MRRFMMNKYICSAFVFLVGAAAGAAVTWFCSKRYFETKAQEEIDSVKEVFTIKKDPEIFTEEQKAEIRQMSKDYGYSVRTLESCIIQYHDGNDKGDSVGDYIWLVCNEAATGRLKDSIKNGDFDIPWFEDEQTKEVEKELKKDLTPKEKSDICRSKPDLSKYAKILKKQGYEDYAKTHYETEEKEENGTDDDDDREGWVEDYNEEITVEPHVISPDEFEEDNGYEKVNLSYYADEVLTDDYDNPIKDLAYMIGSREPFQHFDEYEDDTVFVRNDRIKCDFEITKDLRTYDELLDERPYLKHNNDD